MQRKTLLIILFFFMAGLLSAQDFEGKINKKEGWVVIPGAFYTPETNFGLVVGILNYFNCCGSDIENRPSNIAMNFIYTFEHQYQAVILPTFYIQNGEAISSTQLKLINYPRKYFGIGNHTPDESEPYKDLGIHLYSSYMIKTWQTFYIGPAYHLKYDSVTDLVPGGKLETDDIAGKNKTLLNGAGFSATYDTRDNIFFTKHGQFHQINTLAYPHFAGSDYQFMTFTLDLRFYLALCSVNSIAFQLYGNFSNGELPFLSMPTPGGTQMMRGIYQGRYRDRHFTMMQLEDRVQLSDFFHWTVFASTGQVASHLGQFSPNELKFVYGSGLRIKVAQNGMNLRLDFAGGDHGLQFYFTALEAF